MSGFHQRISASECAAIWQAVASTRDLHGTHAFLIHDLGRMRSRLEMLTDAFPRGTLHSLAIKANPLVEVLREAVSVGAGLEAASMEEVHLALAAGCPPQKLVFDSPAKTRAEIEAALDMGVVLNANEFTELARIDDALKTRPSTSRIGLRVNPELGRGTISHTSVTHAGSKFGVSMSSAHDRILDAFRRYEWLSGLHVHVGSQGCSLDLLTGSVAKMDGLRQEIESHTGRSLSFMDIGGGLPAVYLQDQTSPSPAEYAQQLQREAPQLLESPRTVITEFGRAVQAGCGLAFSRVEYVRPEQAMAVIHLGADFLMRPVYCPDDWKHEFLVLDSDGGLKSGDLQPVTLAGPLCFSGDIVARDVLLPRIDEGDWIAIRDAGAYTLSMWSRHCSRSIPSVFGYDASARDPIRMLREAETPGSVVQYWSQ